jgi:hypothetical protein
MMAQNEKTSQLAEAVLKLAGRKDERPRKKKALTDGTTKGSVKSNGKAGPPQASEGSSEESSD